MRASNSWAWFPLIITGVLMSRSAFAQGTTDDRWKEKLGQRIILQGKALNAKMGAQLSGKDFSIWVDLPGAAWPDGLYHGRDNGELVEVTGTVVLRADMPVFVPQAGEPLRAGIPVPPGTDPNEAAERYILESVEWKLVEPVR